MKPMEKIYIRTDRNGTKYYEDWNCPRCGGRGEDSQWINSGSVCWACRGSGRREKPKIMKEYTPDYALVLEMKKSLRETEKDRYLKAKGYFHLLKSNGYNDDGVKYVYFDVKNPTELRANGGRWNTWLQAWTCPVKVEGFKCYGLYASEGFTFLSGTGWVETGNKLMAWKQKIIGQR